MLQEGARRLLHLGRIQLQVSTTVTRWLTASRRGEEASAPGTDTIASKYNCDMVDDCFKKGRGGCCTWDGYHCK